MNNSDYDNLLQHLRKDLVPIGSILAFPAKKVPEGYLPCEGQELSIQLYPELFEVIGHTWGGSKSTFHIPDLQGQFIRGWDREGDVDPERMFGGYQDDCFQGHVHSVVSCSESGLHSHYVGASDYNTMEANTFYTTYTHIHVTDYEPSGKHKNTDLDGQHKHEIIIGNPQNSSFGKIRTGNETRPKNIALSFCIKVK